MRVWQHDLWLRLWLRRDLWLRLWQQHDLQWLRWPPAAKP